MRRSWGAAALIVVIAASCAEPGSPIIPDPSVIGPPAAAGDHCPRETISRFAQRWFRIADLDQGKTCTGFIEQDECVIALFRDCTDDVSEIPRSWQGSIDKSKKISLARTSESSGGIMARAPSECNGDLVTDATQPIGTWAKLACNITTGEHGGFYFERIEEGIQPFARIDAASRIDVLVDPAQTNFIPDFAVIESKNEIWALVASGDNLAGLWTGAINADGLARSDLIPFRRAERLLVDEDESFALIVEGSRLLRLDVASGSSTISDQGGRIEDVELIQNRVLVAVAIGSQDDPETELRFLDPTTLARLPSPSRSFPGDLDEIVPFEEDGTRSIAVLTFHEDMKVRLIDAELAEPLTPQLLPEAPRYAVSLPGRQAVGFSGRDSNAYFSLRVTDGTVSEKIKLPGRDIRGLFFSERMGRLLISTDEKKLYPFDVDHDRPLLQQILETELSSDLISADSTGRLYSLSKEEGVIDPLLQ